MIWTCSAPKQEISDARTALLLTNAANTPHARTYLCSLHVSLLLVAVVPRFQDLQLHSGADHALVSALAGQDRVLQTPAPSSVHLKQHGRVSLRLSGG